MAVGNSFKNGYQPTMAKLEEQNSVLVEEGYMKTKKQIYHENHAEIVNNDQYPSKDLMVADVVLDRAHGFDVDNTGSQPIDSVLQGAIDDLYENGGGTIYIPHGKYVITSRIDIRPYIYICGDYKDPDTVTDGDYGTLILCKVPPSQEDTGYKANVFRMQGSTGIDGLTFFYPMQFMDAYQPYGYTIEVPGGMNSNMCTVYNIENVTFINSYKGIVASMTPGAYYSITHEQLHISNIKGTCLRNGMCLTNSSEVGTMDNIVFNNKYWANAGEAFNAPNIKNINDFTEKNGIGMIIGDLEWEEITNVFVSDYNIGLYCIDGTRRTDYHMAFIGQFYNLQIKNASYGIFVEKLYENMGIEFFKCVVEGKEYALLSNSPSNYGCLKLSHTTLDGKVCGVNIYYDNKTFDDIGLESWDEGEYVKPKYTLYNAKTTYHADNSGLSDASTAIQNALDDAHANGGGVVYLPAGFYSLHHPLTVYANTQLRGCSNSLSQCQMGNTRGTFLLSYFGQDNTDSDTSTALITIVGENAGVSGLRIGCPSLNPYSQVYTDATCPKYSYIIRANADGAYVTNVYMPGVYNGVEINGDNFVLRKVLGCFYHNSYKVNGNNGLICDCLSNGACTLKPGSELISDYDDWGVGNDRSGKLWSNVYSLTRLLGTVLIANNCQNLTINHMFSFAYKYFIKANNSSIKAINLGFDSQPVNNGAKFVLENGSELICYNSLRDNCSKDGTYFTHDENSFLTVYNVILLLPNNGGKTKANIIRNEYIATNTIGSGTPFLLEKLWLKDIEYTYVDYKDDDGGNQGGGGSVPGGEDEPAPKKGCGGSIMASTGLIGGLSLFGLIVLLITRKRKEEAI